MKNVFNQQDTQEIINRINDLTPTTKQVWGKMSVSQMLAHCNVTYEMIYTDKHSKPNPFMRFIIKAFVKKAVVSEKPYGKSGPTAPQFIIKEEKDFDAERNRLIEHIHKTRELGKNYFENKESLSFGKLTSQEWNNMFFKHLDHHLRQFGV